MQGIELSTDENTAYVSAGFQVRKRYPLDSILKGLNIVDISQSSSPALIKLVAGGSGWCFYFLLKI